MVRRIDRKIRGSFGSLRSTADLMSATTTARAGGIATCLSASGSRPFHQPPEVNFLPRFENDDFPCRLHEKHLVGRANHHSRNGVNISLRVVGGCSLSCSHVTALEPCSEFASLLLTEGSPACIYFFSRCSLCSLCALCFLCTRSF